MNAKKQPAMSKQADGKVPGLRFPGFEGEWEIKQILNFAPLQRGFDLPVNQIVEGEFPVVFSNGILKSHNAFVAKAPGVVTGRSGTIGKVTYVDKDYWPHNTSLWVTDFKNNFPKFVYYFYINLNLQEFSTGSGVPTLNRNDIHVLKRYVPSFLEQQKIATFLSAIDTKLQQLARKKALLEQYKKGVMQQLFSQQLRFKGEKGEEFPAWEEKRLGDFLIPTFRAIDKPNGLYLAIGIRSHCKGTFQKLEADPEKNAMDTLYEVKENDLIVNITFAWEGAIAMVKKEDDGGLVSHRFPTYTFNRGVVIGEFFQYVYPQKRFRLSSVRL
ncbi:MAG: restriction endonuclease subunit S [Saprospiraceae bacterium]|nr:restriction endonuclease subunit S [Saprospiraceae bacterium]